MLSVDMAQGVDAGMFVRDYPPGLATNGPLPGPFLNELLRGPTTVVHLHDLGEHGLVFEPLALAPRLRAFRHVVPDLPGHGRTRPAARPTPLEAFADHFARWLVQRTGPRVALIGHGLGGTLAMLVAERHPDLIRAVVDINSPKSFDDCARLRSLLSKLPIDLTRSVTHARDARLFQAWGHELLALATEGRLAARLGALPMPTLFVTASRSGASPESLKLLNEARVVVAEMPGATGRTPLDRPVDLASILADFLQCRRPLSLGHQISRSNV